MTDPSERSESSWAPSPRHKLRSAVQRSVTALLDQLAPERTLTRSDAPPPPIERHRTPNGCVLQSASTALTVSWFPESPMEDDLGELHIVVWRGTVFRRGAKKGKTGATIVSEHVMKPIEPMEEDALWRDKDGKRYSTAALAAHCLALLDAQMAASAS